MAEQVISRAALEDTYRRLIRTMASADVTSDRVREAAMAALQRARVLLDADPGWVEAELQRIKAEIDPDNAA